MIKNILKYTEQLKHLKRTGWLRVGITEPETVASHSWQMALIALYLSENKDEKYDFDKVIKLSLCHDLAESVIGDITPHDKTYNKKNLKEKEIMNTMAKECQFSQIASLFDEYEQNITPEAKLANDLDKLDMFIQALDYEQKHPDKDLSEFKSSATIKIQTSLGKTLLKEISKNTH